MTALLPFVEAILVLTEISFHLRSLLLWETKSGNLYPIRSILYVKTSENLCLDTDIFMRVLHHMAASHPVESCTVLATHNEKFKNYNYSDHFKFSTKVCHVLWYLTITWRGDKVKPPNFFYRRGPHVAVQTEMHSMKVLFTNWCTKELL